MSYKIGSMNMYKFQANRSDEEISKDIPMSNSTAYITSSDDHYNVKWDD